ncbi:class I fructose-bisphosphate aldolase [Phytoactinopolyspora halotolerans]|uniref:Aldolase n=1 Tax=Phytoactinopolyspora halotolerans TaxID=1981512 RepID=A0A6L9SF24_9ACTN|nr:aldolase [Phytoactinopolyspora halotolerans]NEE03697.1 aldolase [Phytoactinopolyspora halotolerans]
MSVQARMMRMFHRSGTCLNVAIDHGMTNEISLLPGIEDMRSVVRAVVAAGPDTIQLTPGMAPLLRGVPGGRPPALALRTDVSNVYGPSVPRHTFSRLMDHALQTAVREDAVCVVANLLLLPDEPELHEQCVANISALRRESERIGMPLMVEPLVMAPNEAAGGYQVDGDLASITALVRQAAELGADIIKADPCTDPQQYHRVIDVAGGTPVLVRGGGRIGDTEMLERTAELMKQGASGIVYGRNVYQHPEPERILRALSAIVHDGADAVTAGSILFEDPSSLVTS